MGFPGETQEVISRTNRLLDHGRSRCRCTDRVCADAKEKDLYRCKERRKNKAQARRDWLCLRGAENRRKPGSAGDCRVCQKPADWFCRAISPIKKAVSAF